MGETCVVDRSWVEHVRGSEPRCFIAAETKALERWLLGPVWTSDQHPVAQIKGRRGPMCGQILWCRFRSVEMIDEHSNA